MSENNNSILYFLGDWYDKDQQKSVTFYRDVKEDHVLAVIKNRWNKVVKQKKFRLIGEPLIASFMYSYDNPLGEEVYATQEEVDAYYERRKRKGKKGSHSRYLRNKSMKQLKKDGAKHHSLLFGDK